MKHYIFTLLFLYSSLFALETPEDFSIIFKNRFNNIASDITQDYDYSLTLFGFTQHYNSSLNRSDTMSYDNGFSYLESLHGDFGDNIELIKIDKFGDILFSQNPLKTTLAKGQVIKKTPSNGYIVGGSSSDGKIVVQRLNSFGQSLFTLTLGTQNKNRLNDLILLEDGGVLVIGSSIATREKSDNIFQTGLAQSDLYVSRLTRNGKILWSKKYGTLHNDYGVSAIEIFDGSFVVVFTTKYNTVYEVSILRITPNGDKMWIKTLTSEKGLTPFKLITLRNHNLLLSLSMKNDMAKDQIRLIQFDLQKNILIDKKIFTTYSSVLKDIDEFANGNIVGVGYVQDTFDTDALVMLLDSKLSMLHQEHYGKSNYDVFNGLKILENSQVVAVGVTTPELSQEANMWLMKFKHDLTPIKFIEKKLQVEDKLKDIFTTEIKQKVLHIQEKETLVLNDVVFAAGSAKLSQKAKRDLNVIVKKLLPFLKKYKQDIVGLEINGHTSSEWIGVDFTQAYLNNTELSMKRSFSVLSYIFKNVDQETQKFLSKIIKSGALSSSKIKFKEHLIEDKLNSRRVSLRIILKEELKKAYR